MIDYLWLIPLFPLIGSAINGLAGKKLPKSLVSAIACGSAFISFILASISFYELLQLPADQRHVLNTCFTWIASGDFIAKAEFLLDPLSAVMLLVVTGVGFVIHVYSIGYMHNEGGYYRFFAYLNLFLFSMLVLVLAGNFLLMFVGWEGVGLCSYLLIGFYFDKRSAGDAGKKAFIVNRVGDVGFILGVFLVFLTFNSLNFETVFKQISAGTIEVGVLTAIGLLLFVGATGKSAQIPLYVWLPDAMEGPTPVSALIHAATMVTAGVYMVVRCSPIFSRSPIALEVIIVIGILTALMAATIGLVQTDIKRVLAYSTVSQLGYMFVPAMGAPAPARCARIWWRAPRWITARTSSQPSRVSMTSIAVRAGRPSAASRERLPRVPAGTRGTAISSGRGVFGPRNDPQYNIYHCFIRDPAGYLIEIQEFKDPAWPKPEIKG